MLRFGRGPVSVTWGELRLALLGGVAVGLLFTQSLTAGPSHAEKGSPPHPTSMLTDRPASAALGLPVRVVDGDTFVYGRDRIRIADIDTPETHPPRCAYEAELGARATERLRVLLSRPFELRMIDRDEDRYGRKLRIVVQEGRSIGDRMVEEGLARTWEGRRRPWCDEASTTLG